MFLASAAAVVVAACSDDSGGSEATEAPPTNALTTSPATTSTTTTLARIDLPADPFTLGVASGDPDAESVVLWTRLAPLPLEGGGMPADDVPVAWEVSDTHDFVTIAASGQEVAAAADGHSVHAIAALGAGTWYYRFRAGQYVSPTGVTRPAPTGPVAELRFAAGSCQHYQSGFYAAHRDIAESVVGAPTGAASTADGARCRVPHLPRREVGRPADRRAA